MEGEIKKIFPQRLREKYVEKMGKRYGSDLVAEVFIGRQVAGKWEKTTYLAPSKDADYQSENGLVVHPTTKYPFLIGGTPSYGLYASIYPTDKIPEDIVGWALLTAEVSDGLYTPPLIAVLWRGEARGRGYYLVLAEGRDVNGAPAINPRRIVIDAEYIGVSTPTHQSEQGETAT